MLTGFGQPPEIIFYEGSTFDFFLQIWEVVGPENSGSGASELEGKEWCCQCCFLLSWDPVLW